MKTYIGTKQVKAEPMMLGDFIETRKRNPYANDPSLHPIDEKGYLVVYEDGYESWSPKEVFEQAYKCSETFLDRLKIEQQEVYNRIKKCEAFMESGDFHGVISEDYPAFLLFLQREFMRRYCEVLELRMDVAEHKAPIPIPQMTFSVAIMALNFGFAIRRKGWNGKGLFVVKQVPSHIAGSVVPKMQSLPNAAKELILRGRGYINYVNQCFIINENNGRADSWVPSISDVFAEDWEVVL